MKMVPRGQTANATNCLGNDSEKHPSSPFQVRPTKLTDQESSVTFPLPRPHRTCPLRGSSPRYASFADMLPRSLRRWAIRVMGPIATGTALAAIR